MNENIQIIEKPDWVSWDSIHEVLVKAHAKNRSKGINMRKPSLPGEEIKKEIGNKGVMLVALDGEKVVGTGAVLVKQNKAWYNDGKYGYLCFAAILPQYNGKGIYKQLCQKREEVAKQEGLNKLYIDTHHNNTRVIDINKEQGYKRVDIRILPDHWNVVLFKWLDGCPYSDFRCKYEFAKRKSIALTKDFVKRILTNFSAH